MKYRKTIQIISIVFFGLLMALEKIQIWMGVFLIGLLLSTFLGRLYCGYICPINTGMEVIDNNAKKNRRKRRETPKWMKSSWVRYGILGLFLGTMVIVFKTGKKLPVLPALFGIGIILTIFFQPELWHRYLCPYGTLLSIFSRLNKRGYAIKDEGCTQCGLCVRNCPSDAIIWENRKEDPIIIKNECLQCGKCKEVCRFDAIES